MVPIKLIERNMSNIINFPIVEPISEPSIDKWADSEQISGEMLVEFLIAHGIECATDLENFSYTCTSLEIGFGPGKYSSNSSDPQ